MSVEGVTYLPDLVTKMPLSIGDDFGPRTGR